MKRWIHSSSQAVSGAAKKRDLQKEDYNAAKEVGLQLLEELHTRYPETYIRSTPRSTKRSHSWSDHPYVMLDTGLHWSDIGDSFSKDIIPWMKEQRAILNDLIVELGYDPVDDFQAAIDGISGGQKLKLVVYDMQQSAWKDN